MRKAPRRTFTVEAKAGGRRASAIIPTRIVTQPSPSRPTLDLSAPATTSAPVEKRRILPSLIVPEVPQVELEAQRAREEAPVRRPRGRPRKVQQTASATAAPQKAAPVASVEPVPADPAAPHAQLFRKRKSTPAPELPRGERWKTRRLGRWSR